MISIAWASSAVSGIASPATEPARAHSAAGGPGWEYVQVCVDDASRLSFSQIHPDEKAVSVVAHLRGSCMVCVNGCEGEPGDDGQRFVLQIPRLQAACAELGIRHIRTKPYTPQTNGKAERFIQTALREWAYARAYQASDDRAADLPVWTPLSIGIDRIRR